MILGIDCLSIEEKDLLCEMINRSRDGDCIEATPEILGCYLKDAVQKAVTLQEKNLTEEGVIILKSILGKIQGQ